MASRPDRAEAMERYYVAMVFAANARPAYVVPPQNLICPNSLVVSNAWR
jgi:hypothetical protein